MKNQHTPKAPTQSPPRSEAAKTVRFNISMPAELVKRLDDAARNDYTTRSDMIRMAVLWYLRPAGQELNQADPDIVLQTLQKRRLHSSVKKMLNDSKNAD